MAAAGLLRHRMRTGLTVLAVGIGIAAVMGTSALGLGSAARVQQQISNLGEDFLWIRAGNRNVAGVRTGAGGARTLTVADVAAIQDTIPDVTMCSPRISGREQVIAADQNWNTSYRGVWPDFFDIRDRSFESGTAFTDFDQTSHARVLVMGDTVAERLFGEEDPVGRQIRLGQFYYRVLGVLASKGASRGGLDRDDAVFLPLSTVHADVNRRTWIDDVMCSVTTPALMTRAQDEIAQLLRVRHNLDPGDPDDFQVQQPVETVELRARTTQTLGLLLTAIGAVSLVVGGVGIMNIMLVSVSERRREIGVRMAIGARVRDIRLQFLLEAAAIGLLGGLSGIVLGWGGSLLLTWTLGAPTVISHSLMVWVTIAAIGAGLLFGYLPAHRASSLDPIEAIRGDG
jgi:putative ABC transport system permease protein